MENKERIYPAKVLLFGEYTVIHGSEALAIPFHQFSASWKRDETKGELFQESWSYLNPFLSYLRKKVVKQNNFSLIEEKIERDINQGVYFFANIPIGYGLGSSGAFCAAVYDRYVVKDKELSIAQLQTLFGQMESHFHGSSSGLDPLVSFLDQPLISTSDQNVTLLENLPERSEEGGVFLFNTGISRKTAPLVNVFLEKCKDPIYQEHINEELSTYNEWAITQYIQGDRKELLSSVQSISAFQRNYFKEMIPDAIVEVWDFFFDNELAYMKLCGAGGGGFMLCFVPNKMMFLEKNTFLEKIHLVSNL